MTELQVTTCVFGSSYVFHLTAEGLTVCPFFGGFLHDLPIQTHIGRTQISRVKVLASWAKRVQNGGEKGG